MLLRNKKRLMLYPSRASNEHRRRSSACGRFSRTLSVWHSSSAPEVEGWEESTTLLCVPRSTDVLPDSVFISASEVETCGADGCSEIETPDFSGNLLSALSMMTSSKLSSCKNDHKETFKSKILHLRNKAHKEKQN